MNAVAAFGRRLVRGPVAARTLARLGIDPHRYWLVYDLFGTLGARQEVTLLGADYSLRTAALLLFLFSSLVSVLLVLAGPSPVGYLLVFLGLTAFLLSMHLVAEVAENLVNPVAELTLAHQPIGAGTWSAAKLSHLLTVVVYLVGGINVVPAVGGILLDHAGWGGTLAYPAVHLLAALGVGLVVALLCCSLFGWLVRFVAVGRLKAVAALAQALPLVVVWVYTLSGNPPDQEPGTGQEPGAGQEPAAAATSLEMPAALGTAVEAMPGGLRGTLAAAGAIVAVGAVGFGLRALSSAHLLRVAGSMRSGVRAPRRRRRRLPGAGPWVARLAGGPAARAGYEYVRALLLRDWQFLRNTAMNGAGILAAVVALPIFGREISPFRPGDDFALAHMLPHALGLATLIACRFLAFGNDYKGAWSFSAAPESSLRPFAAGVYAALWVVLVAAPHLALLLFFGWFWGLPDAAGFVVFSAAVASLYLAGALRLTDGLPFGRQAPGTRTSLPVWLGIAVFIVGGISVGLQVLLFRSVVAVAAVTLVVAGGAYLLARLTLPGLASRIQSSLRRAPAGSMFRFVGEHED